MEAYSLRAGPPDTHQSAAVLQNRVVTPCCPAQRLMSTRNDVPWSSNAVLSISLMLGLVCTALTAWPSTSQVLAITACPWAQSTANSIRVCHSGRSSAARAFASLFGTQILTFRLSLVPKRPVCAAWRCAGAQRWRSTHKRSCSALRCSDNARACLNHAVCPYAGLLRRVLTSD